MAENESNFLNKLLIVRNVPIPRVYKVFQEMLIKLRQSGIYLLGPLDVFPGLVDKLVGNARMESRRLQVG